MEKFDFSKIHEEEKSSDIDQYFTKSQLESLSEYEKIRYRNMKKNYDMMVKMGLPAQMPDFMQKRKNCKKTENIHDHTDSDEEWKPVKSQKSSKDYNQGVTKKTRKNITYSDDDEDWEPRKPKTKNRKVSKVKETKQKPNIQEEESSKTSVDKKHRYPLREVPVTNYMYLEVPDDDEFIYCDDCEREYEGDCPVHISIRIMDSKAYSKDEKRAIQTLPEGLAVRESGIPNAGLGVWSNKDFPCRSVFGPYEGEITKDACRAHSTGYSWQVYVEGCPSHFVDAFNKSKSNWMRYVNCARNEDEQNLVAYQHKGEIYYRSFKEIPSGTELLVWYGADYGKDLGIERLDVKSLLKPKYINGEAIFRCPMCKTSFSNDRFLSKHLLCKHGTKLEWLLRPQSSTVYYRYQCKMCNSSFSLRHMAIKHYSQEHGSDSADNIVHVAMLSTQTNNHQFSNACSLSSNICDVNNLISTIPSEKEELNQLHTCVLCRRQFNDSQELSLHLKQHALIAHDNTCKNKIINMINDTSISCDPICNVVTCNGRKDKNEGIHSKSKFKLEQFKANSNNKKPYKCDVCGKGFNQSKNLQTHMRTHTGDKPYKCDVCGKGFSQSNNLQTHMRTHTGDKPYKCDVCGKGFNVSNNLQRHMRTHTDDKPYKCDVCGKGFSQSSDLQRHMRTHTGDKPYKCEVCGKGFSVSNNLQMHMRTHTGDKPFKCDVCGKGFSRSDVLQTHMRTHTGDKPYKCDVCSKGFNQNVHLQTHMRTHTGDKPYKCDACGKGFSQSNDLQKHMRTHTGDKPFKCDVCGKGFSRSDVLQTHMRIHTDDKPYKCDVCGKGFNQSQNLQTHMRTHG